MSLLKQLQSASYFSNRICGICDIRFISLLGVPGKPATYLETSACFETIIMGFELGVCASKAGYPATRRSEQKLQTVQVDKASKLWELDCKCWM